MAQKKIPKNNAVKDHLRLPSLMKKLEDSQKRGEKYPHFILEKVRHSAIIKTHLALPKDNRPDTNGVVLFVICDEMKKMGYPEIVVHAVAGTKLKELALLKLLNELVSFGLIKKDHAKVYKV